MSKEIRIDNGFSLSEDYAKKLKEIEAIDSSLIIRGLTTIDEIEAIINDRYERLRTEKLEEIKSLYDELLDNEDYKISLIELEREYIERKVNLGFVPSDELGYIDRLESKVGYNPYPYANSELRKLIDLEKATKGKIKAIVLKSRKKALAELAKDKKDKVGIDQ